MAASFAFERGMRVGKSERIVGIALAAVLACGGFAPLAGCSRGVAKEQPSQQEEKISEDARWDVFDDGSDVLSLDCTHVHGNVNDMVLSLLLERGSFAPDVSADDVALGGALAGWRVDQFRRADDATLSLFLVRGEDASGFGASVAFIGVASDAVELPDAGDAAALSGGQEGLFAEDINGMKGVRWPDPAEAVIVDADVSAGQKAADETRAADGDGVSNEDSADAFADEGEAAGAETEDADSADSENSNPSEEGAAPREFPYWVAVPVANPSLAIDYDATRIEDGALVYRVEARDFAFDEEVSASDFDLRDATDASIVEAERLSGAEVDLHVAKAGSRTADGALDSAALILRGSANESGEALACPLLVPAPALSVEWGTAQGNAVSLDVRLENSPTELSTGNVSVRAVEADGAQSAVEMSRLSVRDDGWTLLLEESALDGASSVIVEVADAENVAGERMSCMAAIPCIATDMGPADGSEAQSATGIGSAALSALAEFNWKQARECILGIEPEGEDQKGKYGTARQGIIAARDRVGDADMQARLLLDGAAESYRAAVVGDALTLVEDIKGQELRLFGLYDRCMASASDEGKEDAARRFHEEGKDELSLLTANLNKLHNLLMAADAATGDDLVSVYDKLMAESFNWGVQAYGARMAFRDTLWAVWAAGAQMVYVACGTDEHSGEHAASLASLEAQTKQVNELMKACALDESCCKAVVSAEGDAGTAEVASYYCYTVNEWCSVRLGSASIAKWDEGLKGLGAEGRAASPFSVWSEGKMDDWGARYLGTTAVKMLVERLHDGQALGDELAAIGAPVAKYLVASCRFDADDQGIYASNDWHFDTFELSAAKKGAGFGEPKGFAADAKHYDAFVYAGRSEAIGHVNWMTPADSLLALAREDAPDVS